MPAGRPTLYSEELAERIAEQLAEGFTLNEICKADDMPSVWAVMKWRHSNPEFFQLYARAREAQGHALADLGVAIARSRGLGDPADAKVRLEAIKWTAGKWAAHDFGDKNEQTHRFPDGPGMIVVNSGVRHDPESGIDGEFTEG